MRQEPEILEVWDWYDGLVSGIVSFRSTSSSRDEVFLASAIAWSCATRRRALCLVRLDDPQLDTARSIAKQEWHQAAAQLRGYCQSIAARALVVLTHDHSKGVLSVKDVEMGSVEKQLLGGIEDAMLPERECWLAVECRGSGIPLRSPLGLRQAQGERNTRVRSW